MNQMVIGRMKYKIKVLEEDVRKLESLMSKSESYSDEWYNLHKQVIAINKKAKEYQRLADAYQSGKPLCDFDASMISDITGEDVTPAARPVSPSPSRPSRPWSIT